MGYQANVLKVMIASPGDVTDERRIVTEEIHRWNDAHAESRNIILQPIKWETHSTPRLGQPAQAELNQQITDDADILVGIFGTRIGTPTQRHVSGTVEEIKNHVAAGKTAKVYFSDAPVQPSKIDQEQYKSLQEFKEECKSLGLYGEYSDIPQFQRDFKQHLDIELNAARYRWLSSAEASHAKAPSQISDDAMLLLTKAAQNRGIILVRSSLAGVSILVESEMFNDSTPRSVARWRSAVDELDALGLARERKRTSGIYEVTNLGYRAVDKAEASKPLHISASTTGTPDQQELEIIASKPINLFKIDYLHSTDACVTSQSAEFSGLNIKVKLENSKLVELSNSPRPDKSPFDHSGPAKLRIIYEVNGNRQQMILPVALQPKFVNNTQWITLTRSAELTT